MYARDISKAAEDVVFNSSEAVGDLWWRYRIPLFEDLTAIDSFERFVREVLMEEGGWF